MFVATKYGAAGIALEERELALSNFQYKWIRYPRGLKATVRHPVPGKPYDSVGIQRAIDTAHAAGGGTVLVPAGDYLVGPMRLRSRVCLHLEPGARLWGSPRLEDYVNREGLDDVAYPQGNSPVTDQPVITPRSGPIPGQVTVSMSSSTTGAVIRCTTDGSTPSSTHGTVFSAPFVLTATAHVQAIAYADGKNDSAVSVADYTVLSHWIGGADNTNWSTTGNWDPAISPAGTDVVFDNTATNKVTVTNNIVDADITIGSLTYTNVGSGYHVTRIGSGTTLTIDGSTSPARALMVGGYYGDNLNTYVKMVGGGALTISTPGADFYAANACGGALATVTLDLAGLGAFNANVTNFYVGRGSRTQSTMTLAKAGPGTNTITASVLSIGDSNGGGEQNGTSSLNLGPTNLLNADTISIGAPATNIAGNCENGTLIFQSGLTGATVRIRGKSGGTSRANLTVGSQGAVKTSRGGVTGIANFTGGSVDAQLGVVVLGDGRGYWSSGSGHGGVSGTLNMGMGAIDAVSVLLGRSLNNSSANTTADPAVGVLSVSNGQFTVGSIALADNNSGAAQPTTGTLMVSGTGTVVVTGDVTMGTRIGTDTNVAATIDLAGGSMTVGGNMVEGAGATGVTSTVYIHGGKLDMDAGNMTVDNITLQSGTLTNVNGCTCGSLFSLKAGTATVDRLVMTNSAGVMQIELRGTGAGDYGHLIANSQFLLDGGLSVTVTNYTPRAGDLWTVVGGTGVRSGVFSIVNLTEGLGLKVAYTSSGFDIYVPSKGSTIMIR